MILATGRIKGFTFVELLLVIIIIGILIAISLPNLKKTFNNLRLDNFSRELQAFMNYLHERSVVEGKIIYLNLDNDEKEIWARIQDAQSRLKTLPLPDDIRIESENKEILFYPDGSIDNITIGVVNLDNQKITLTTKGVFGGVKLLFQE